MSGLHTLDERPQTQRVSSPMWIKFVGSYSGPSLLDPIQDQMCGPNKFDSASKRSGRLTVAVLLPGEIQPTETGVESNIHSSSLATCDLLMSYHSCKMNMNKWVSQTHVSRYVGEVYAIQLSRQIILLAQSLFTNPICVIIIHTQKTCLDIPKQDTLRSCKIVTERHAVRLAHELDPQQ
jgi:hypothetical protein